jgi:EAL domain-containing protein (putative c-di-GMP-specific phosphodiesterase class I)
MLQLDHQYVIDLGSNRDARTVTQAVIALAHGLELTVLAEGIERQDQIGHLRELGCELGQGQFICPPLPAGEVLAFLLRNHQRATRHEPGAEPPNLRRLTP